MLAGLAIWPEPLDHGGAGECGEPESAAQQATVVYRLGWEKIRRAHWFEGPSDRGRHQARLVSQLSEPLWVEAGDLDIQQPFTSLSLG